MAIEIEEQYDCIYRYCYYRLHHVQKAEDLTQEVFLRYLESGYLENGRPLAYLYTIARNLCIDEFRKKKEEYIEDCYNEERSKYMAEVEFQELLVDTMTLKQALLSLNEEERELIMLRYVNEVGVADLAEIFGISRFSMYRRNKGALKNLKRKIKE